ncbi:MBOAT family O-acyltransferase [Hahella sp. NBU794]|uniref:MBOAT family O-acyltransferase n=1 Tax=Hahella sp. NBU794 TaxID=3422590 RepID=UPI003D7009C0
MKISYLTFYLLVFPAILCLFSLCRRVAPRYARLCVALASMLFLAIADRVSFGILLGVVLINYHLIRGMEVAPHRKRLYKLIGVSLSLTPLIFYKLFGGTVYFDGDLAQSLLLPLGLAFYSLQQVTAIVDSASGQVKPIQISDYLFFSFFFATLTSGPIITYKDMMGQLQQDDSSSISSYNIDLGVSLFILGFAKKTLIADPIESMTGALLQVSNINPETYYSISELLYIFWGGMLSFYYVFSAYSDMAIGIALLFGVRLPVNFNSPLKARTPQQYVMSWHMSFMAFVRQYVFQPVYLMLKRTPIKDLNTRYLLAWAGAVFCSFGVVGVWHAPDIVTVAISLGVAITIVGVESSSLVFRRRKPASARTPSLLSRAILLIFICLCAMKFTHPDFEIVQSFTNMLTHNPTLFVSDRLDFLSGYLHGAWIEYYSFFPTLTTVNRYEIAQPTLSPDLSMLHILLVTLITFYCPNSMQIFGLLEKNEEDNMKARWSNRMRAAIAAGVLLCISLSFANNGSSFSYGG